MLSYILKSEKKVERNVDPRATAIAVPDLAEALRGRCDYVKGKKTEEMVDCRLDIHLS